MAAGLEWERIPSKMERILPTAYNVGSAIGCLVSSIRGLYHGNSTDQTRRLLEDALHLAHLWDDYIRAYRPTSTADLDEQLAKEKLRKDKAIEVIEEAQLVLNRVKWELYS